ncbi:hypothetical protein HanXRQr2_Chr04g0184861 [Helianthus annuus]|uniref:Uncharacterized protein n=1 Tax=Helianthus annuus TaxID=4232 RepID=A0A9K3JAS5_HELAN|nr:hypothetical protein HanXRQr2_Chr04g0184861 [Helianthus annuus]
MVLDLLCSKIIFTVSSRNKLFHNETISPFDNCTKIFLLLLPNNSLFVSLRRLVSLSSSSSEPDILDISKSLTNESDVHSSKSSSFTVSFPATNSH